MPIVRLAMHLRSLMMQAPKAQEGQARLVSALLIAMTPLTLIGSLFQSRPAERLLMQGVAMLFLALYGLSRTRRTKLAALLTVTSLVALPIVMLSLRHPHSFEGTIAVLMWGGLGFVLGGIVLPTWWLLALVLCNQLLLVLLVPRWLEHLSLRGVLYAESFYFAISVVMLVVNELRRRDQLELDRRDALHAESTRRHREVLESLHEVVFQTDLEGRVRLLNPAWTTISGLEQQACLGQPMGDFLLPEDRPRWSDCLQSLLVMGGGGRQLEVRLQTDGDRPCWVLASMRKLVSPDAGVIGVIGTLSDVTQQHEARLALEESERRFRSLFEQSPIGIVLANAAGHVLESNPALHRMFGYSEAELLGRHLSSFSRPAEASRIGVYLDRAVQGDRGVLRIEKQSVRKDGTEIWCRIVSTPIADDAGEVHRFVLMIEDVTDLKQAELELRRSEERWHLALEGSHDGIWDADLASGDTYFSERALEILGIAENEPPGNPRDLIHPEDRAPFEAMLRDHLAGRIPFVVFELRMGRPDHKWVLVRGKARHDETGRAVRIVGSITDHTLHKEAEVALVKAREVAIKASQAKTDFLATMSHEMRTPLNAIVGMADVLWDSPLSEEQREYVRIFRRAGTSLNAMINGLLDLSRVESGHFELETIDFDLAETVSEVTGALALPAREKGLQLLTYVAPDVPRLLSGDPLRLRQILFNLIGNAIKFTAEGQVEIRIERDQAPGHVTFGVSDTGIGIPLEKQELIFHTFTQVDTSTTRTYGGTGLGLAIARQLVELMGGGIGVQSMPGEGSVFRFTIPVRPQQIKAPIRATEPQATPASGGPPLTLLLVEDNADNIRLVTALLKDTSHRIVTAWDGAEGLQRFKGERFDLVLMDLQMPVLDGNQATEAIRAWETQEDRRPTPIVAMTASTLDSEVRRALEAGCTSHLPKPLRKVDLLALCRRYQRIVSLDGPEEGCFADVPAELAEFAPSFLSNRRWDLVRMRRDLAKQDLDAIRSTAHDTKGMGTSYGFPVISELGREVEAAAMSADVTAISARLDELEAFLAYVRLRPT